ncbi:MAG: HNH endonuclease [Rhodoferax sp.]|nr:HNH endonuclease [Rhodoferax sp.]
MRPVQRGASPQTTDFARYQDAKPVLVERLGPYCSYCERRLPTTLAVEHIQPKGLPQYQGLKGRWENFLLACANCNANKKNKDVVPAEVLLPDRDNTFAAIAYLENGTVDVARCVPINQRGLVSKLLSLLEWNRHISSPLTMSANDKLTATELVNQRMEVWGVAIHAKNTLNGKRTDTSKFRVVITNLALYSGFFSIWMAVFHQDIDMRKRLIDAFHGTRGSACFDANTTQPVSPAPNPDRLEDGAKF